MKLSNLLKKESPELTEGLSPEGGNRQKTKTIDLPPLSESDPKSKGQSVDLSKLAGILKEDELRHDKRLEELKMKLNSGNYSPDSKKTAFSLLDYLKGMKASKNKES